MNAEHNPKVSGFCDLRAERHALHSVVFPRVQSLLAREGLGVNLVPWDWNQYRLPFCVLCVLSADVCVVRIGVLLMPFLSVCVCVLEGRMMQDGVETGLGPMTKGPCGTWDGSRTPPPKNSSLDSGVRCCIVWL